MTAFASYYSNVAFVRLVILHFALETFTLFLSGLERCLNVILDVDARWGRQVKLFQENRRPSLQQGEQVREEVSSRKWDRQCRRRGRGRGRGRRIGTSKESRDEKESCMLNAAVWALRQ